MDVIIATAMEKFKKSSFWQAISVDSSICHGQACVKGTRIPVHQIVHMLANGDSIEDLLTEYPSLTKKDVLSCLDYVASLAEEEVHPFETEIG